MAKKISTPLLPKFSFGSTQQLIMEARNVSRWNPSLGLKWMDEAKIFTESPVILKLWNQIAKQINKNLDELEKAPYYDEKEYWGTEKPRRLELLEEIITLEDYVALQKFSKVK